MPRSRTRTATRRVLERRELDLHVDVAVRVLDRVVDQVRQGGLQFVGIAHHRRLRRLGDALDVGQRFGGQVVPHAREVQAFAHQCREDRCGTWCSTRDWRDRPARSTCSIRSSSRSLSASMMP